MPPRKIRKFEGAPGWIITFADLSTLLLTFFVLLISFSNQDIIKFREMLGSVKDAFGVEIRRKGEYQAALTGHGSEEIKDEKKKEEEEAKKLKRQLVKVSGAVKKAAEKTEINDDAEVMNTAEGVLVRVKGESLFAPGSVKISPKAVPMLDEMARILRNSDMSVIVEGHTDNVPINSALYSSNWELSGARAAVVARYLISKKAPAEKITAIGYGGMRPVASNDTRDGRAKNRRVEFLIRKYESKKTSQ